MEQAIANLRKRFSEPTKEVLEEDPVCNICWIEYDGNDQAVVLPCGHMFGEKCIITWAQGESPSGRFNGCPLCQAELLPPRWGYVIDYLMVGLLMAMYEDILQTANFLAANTRVLSISFGLSLGARICDIFPDLPTGSLVELGSAFSLLVFWIYWSLNNVGLRRTLAIIIGGTGFLYLWVWLY